MKRAVLSVLLLSAVLLSAVQPGLPSSDVKFIKEFRLPAWKTMYFDFNLAGGASNRADSYKNYEAGYSSFERQSSFNLRFRPDMSFRSESEKRITEMGCELNSQFNYNSTKNKDSQNELNINRIVKLEPTFNYSNKSYQSNGDFINLGGSLSYEYDYSYRNKNYEIVDRSANIEVVAGYGSGKVREVTSVVKALRFNKRYSSLGKGSFTDNEIGEIAKVISKSRVYYDTYDRSSKYFWDDMYKAANGKMEGLSGYETFMVMDGLGDISGTRYEGSEISANARYIWIDENNDSSNYSQFDDFDARYGVFAPYLQARYYTNLSIDYQVGFEAEGSYQIPTSEKELFEQNIILSLNHSELYCITDRILYLGDATFIYKDTEYEKDITSELYAVNFTNNFRYYLEDNISLDISAKMVWDKKEEVNKYADMENTFEDLDWIFNISLNYRFRTM